MRAVIQEPTNCPGGTISYTTYEVGVGGELGVRVAPPAGRHGPVVQVSESVLQPQPQGTGRQVEDALSWGREKIYGHIRVRKYGHNY